MKTVTSRQPGKRASSSRSPRSRVAESSPAYGSNICYVESSALLAALLEHDADALEVLRGAFTLVTSELTFAECQRAIVRAESSGRLAGVQSPGLKKALATFAARCTVVAVTSEILERTGYAFPIEPVRTLDGIHLATIEALGEPTPRVTVLTRDRRVHSNAIAMGFTVA